MRKLLHGFALLTLTAASGVCSTFIFQGTLNTDNQVALFNFTVDNPNTQVTFQSFGYAGGTLGGTTAPAGGFAPNAIVFDSNGAEIISDAGGHCGSTGTDPTTGNCDDPFFVNDFDPGTYTLALAVWDNAPLDGNLADGFVQDLNPGFTCAEFGLSGNFCDVTTALGTSRTGDFALSIAGADSAAEIGAPEPGTLALGFSAAVFGALLRRRKSSLN